MKRLRTKAAADRLGIHPDTLRAWADQNKIPCVFIGDERRFDIEDLDALVGLTPQDKPRREALYIRVSGTTGQETSLKAQEKALKDSAMGEVAGVYKDKGSGLNEKRPGLLRLLRDGKAGKFTVVRVTHEDRLARFGVTWLKDILNEYGVTVEVLHSKGKANPGGTEELLEDFMSLVATFSGRMYGIRSRDTRKELLTAATEKAEQLKVAQ